VERRDECDDSVRAPFPSVIYIVDMRLIHASRYTLFPFTNSWWNGSNIPGKKAQNMTYIGGIDNYEKQCREKMEGWKGFEVVAA